MKLALIDHYDSFTFNVLGWLASGQDGFDVEYMTYDDERSLTRLLERPKPLIVSPGPKRPEDAPTTLAVLRALLGKVPILGLCLGHQMLGSLAGAEIVRSAEPLHGSRRSIRPVRTSPLLLGLEAGFAAAVYHSLVVDARSLAKPWTVDAIDELGEVQAISRVIPGEAPAFGIQFHPESFLSEGASTLLGNWRAVVQASAEQPLSMPS